MPWQLGKREINSLPMGAAKLSSDDLFARKIEILAITNGTLLPRTVLHGAKIVLPYGYEGLSVRQTRAGGFILANGAGYGFNIEPTIPTSSVNKTVIAVFNKFGTASGKIVKATGPSSQDDGYVVLNSNGTVTATANGDVSITSNDVAVDGINTVVFVNNRAGASQVLFLNGKKQTSTGASTSQGGFAFSLLEAGQETTDDFSIGLIGALSIVPVDAEIFNWGRKPWRIFEPDRMPWFIPSSVEIPQYLYPMSDISVGQWIPSTGGSISPLLADSDSGTYAYVGSASTFITRLTAGSDPNVDTGHIIDYQIPPGNGNVSVQIRQGTSTVIATAGPHALTGAQQSFSYTLTQAEAAQITDYTNLHAALVSS